MAKFHHNLPHHWKPKATSNNPKLAQETKAFQIYRSKIKSQQVAANNSRYGKE
jgi:hypothetical protein